MSEGMYSANYFIGAKSVRIYVLFIENAWIKKRNRSLSLSTNDGCSTLVHIRTNMTNGEGFLLQLVELVVRTVRRCCRLFTAGLNFSTKNLQNVHYR